MKTLTLILSVFLLASFSLSAQADRIVGFWLSEDEDAQIKIFKATNGKYYGKIVWLDEPLEDDGVTPKVDDENPDVSLQDRPIMGLQLLNAFQYDSKDKEWEGGTIYDPDNGKTYSCYMWFDEDPNKLNIKGFVMGMRFVGRRTIWTKETKQR